LNGRDLHHIAATLNKSAKKGSQKKLEPDFAPVFYAKN
tara:strand:+ start:343 stop:456 length:114 start_codon:yes stop_codon:yes gene_type:complete